MFGDIIDDKMVNHYGIKEDQLAGAEPGDLLWVLTPNPPPPRPPPPKKMLNYSSTATFLQLPAEFRDEPSVDASTGGGGAPDSRSRDGVGPGGDRRREGSVPGGTGC